MKMYKSYETFKNEAEQSSYSSIFSGVNSIFYDYIKGNKVEEIPNPISFEKVLGFTDEKLDEYFTFLYDEKAIAFPYSDNEFSKIYNKIKYIVYDTTLANIRKYYAALYAFQVEYNPIENYNSTEKEATGLKKDKGTSTTNPGTTDVSTISSYENRTISENQTAPYDSESYKNTSKTTTTHEYTGGAPSTTITHSGSDTTTVSYDNTMQTALGNDYKVGSNNEETDRVLTRKGNIGVTTTQQMLQSEIDLKSLNVIKMFFNDIKEQILLSVWA